MKIKNILYACLPLGIWAMLLTGCKDDDQIAPLPKPVPLTLALESNTLVMGETLNMTFSVKDEQGAGLAANEDFDIYLAVVEGTTDVSKAVFNNFPEMVTFPKGETDLEISVPVKSSGITKSVLATLTAFARGYKMDGSEQVVKVSDYYRTTISIKGNSDLVVREGDTFILQMKVEVPANEDIVVTVTPGAGESDFYENLPSTLTIAAGELSVESEPITMLADGYPFGDRKLTFKFTSESVHHPLLSEEMNLTQQDVDTPLGSELEDERYVYTSPEMPFYSEKNAGKFKEWWGNKKALSMKSGTPHPNESLAAEGWKFVNAMEFHAIDGQCRNAKNSNGVCPVLGFGAQNTVMVQKFMAVNNDRYTDVTDEGYLKMWAVKEKMNATGGGSGQKDYGFSACFSGKFNMQGAYAPQHTWIGVGTRIETRARIRGNKNGFNAAIWLQGNTQSQNSDPYSTWPRYGEIDVMENPAGRITGMNTVHQTIHMGDQATGTYKNPTTQNGINKMDQWNIYWVEIVDDHTIKMGINGKTTKVVTPADLGGASSEWPFNLERNPLGFHYLLTLGAPSAWSLGYTDTPPLGWDSGFSTITYEASKTNQETPRMEIDWIRYYSNDNYFKPTSINLHNPNTHTYY